MLTTKEAAERLQVSEASIRVWLNDETEKARRFPNAVKFGRDWQIPASDVDKLPAGVRRGRPSKASTDGQKPTTAKQSAGKGTATKRRGGKVAR
jgi:excisionase family DNA binding protein